VTVVASGLSRLAGVQIDRHLLARGHGASYSQGSSSSVTVAQLLSLTQVLSQAATLTDRIVAARG
jgi:hypothetical protein